MVYFNLQHFFGLIRHAAGCEDHPTASMFIQIYRLLSVYSLLRLPRRRLNSYVNNSQLELSIRPAKSATKRQAAVDMAAACIDHNASVLDDDVDLDLDAVDVPMLSNMSASPVDNIVFYVAGFVLRHCRKTTTCGECIAGLTGERNSLPQAALINIKLRGALQWPSESLFRALRESEEYISAHLAKGANPEAFSELLVQILPVFFDLKAKLCCLHASSMCAEIAVYYIVTRLHWHVKQKNKNAQSTSSTKQHRKKAKLC